MEIGISDGFEFGWRHIVHVHSLVSGNKLGFVGKGNNGHIEIHVGILALQIDEIFMYVGNRRIDLPDPLALHGSGCIDNEHDCSVPAEIPETVT